MSEKGTDLFFFPARGKETFDFLGCTHYWAKTRREYHVRNKNRWDFPMINPYGYKLIRPTI
jgi:hypothetical protein